MRHGASGPVLEIPVPGLTERFDESLVLAYPLITLTCIVVTANHYWIDAVDGLLFSGGSDIDPAQYGHDTHPETTGIRAERGDVEHPPAGGDDLAVALRGPRVQDLDVLVGRGEKGERCPRAEADRDRVRLPVAHVGPDRQGRVPVPLLHEPAVPDPRPRLLPGRAVARRVTPDVAARPAVGRRRGPGPACSQRSG